MSPLPRNPHLYEINLMTWLSELGEREKRRISLTGIPKSEWVNLKDRGIDCVWLMGIWERSRKSGEIARNLPELCEQCRAILPNFDPEDIVGSPYAVHDYVPDPRLGSMKDLVLLKNSVENEGLSLILDLVPNHTALDHPWVGEHPEWYIRDAPVGEGDACREGFFRVADAPGKPCLANGRDPYFPPWTDTAQLNYQHPEAVRAMLGTISKISSCCHGLRCDMAMLVLRDIFQRTWADYLERGMKAEEFWPRAIGSIRSRGRPFFWIAEAYWGTEDALFQSGFDYIYDKTFYDLLRNEDIQGLKGHLSMPVDRQEKMIRFLENHDEPRAMEAFGPKRVRSALVIQSTVPGMKFWQHGQFEGNRLKVPVQLRRAPLEEPDPEFRTFCDKLLREVAHRVFKEGDWRICKSSGWPDNQSHQRLLVWCRRLHEERRLIVVNFSSGPVQGYVHLPQAWLPQREMICFHDSLKDERFHRSVREVETRGLYVALGEMDFHFFRIEEE